MTDILATLDAVELLAKTRHEQHAGKCNVVTGILYRAEQRLNDDARKALTGDLTRDDAADDDR